MLLMRYRGPAHGAGDIGQLNHAAAKMPLRPQLQDGGLFLVGANPVEAALSVLAEDAIDLIASPAVRAFGNAPDAQWYSRTPRGRASDNGAHQQADAATARKFVLSERVVFWVKRTCDLWWRREFASTLRSSFPTVAASRGRIFALISRATTSTMTRLLPISFEICVC